MEPSLLMALFAGLSILSTWISVPFTTLNPQRPITERLVGSFQLTAVAHGISTLCCRPSQAGDNFSALWNQTLPSELPLPEETPVMLVSQTVADEETSTTTTSALIPTPTAPFGGAKHVVYNTFEESPPLNNPERFIAELVVLVGKHVRRHTSFYHVAILLIVQVSATWYIARSNGKQSPVPKPLQETTEQSSESSNPSEGASVPLALLQFIQRSLSDYQNRTDAAMNQKLEDLLGKFEPLERRITELHDTVSATPQQSTGQVGDGFALIQSQVDDLVARFEQLRGQVDGISQAPEVLQDNGNAIQIEALTREVAQLKAEGAEMRMKPWETAMEETTNELQTLRALLKETDNSAIQKTIEGISSRVGAVEAQHAEKPWETSDAKLAVQVMGLKERFQALPPADQEAMTLIQRVKKDLDELKGFAVVNSELRSVEADVKIIGEKVDSKPWAEALTRVENEIISLRQEMSSFKGTSSTLKKEQKKIAGDVKTVSQSVEQLKADQPWKRDEVLTGTQLAAVNDVVALKDTLATKEETKALAESVQRTEGALESWISKTWPADRQKLEQSSKEMERSLRSEIDSTRGTFATNKDLDVLSTQVKELAARPVGSNSGDVATSAELAKVKKMAREAEHSAMGSSFDIEKMRSKLEGFESALQGSHRIIVAHNADIEECAKKLGVERRRPVFGDAPAPSKPAPVTVAPKAEAKQDKPTTSTSEVSPAETKSTPKSEEPKEDSKSDKGKQRMTESDETQGKAEPTPKSPETSTSAEPKPSGSDDEPKPSGLEASRWATPNYKSQPLPKPAGLLSSQWATASTSPERPLGDGQQKKGKNKKHQNRK